MKPFLIIYLASFLLITSACTSTFLVYKEGKGATFLESSSKGKYDLLCASGDLAKVLADSHLEPAMKSSLYRYNCSPTERSSAKFKQVFSTMTVAQRKDIKSAFRKNGYAINKLPC
jgi:hypothetical protein